MAFFLNKHSILFTWVIFGNKISDRNGEDRCLDQGNTVEMLSDVLGVSDLKEACCLSWMPCSSSAES